MENSGLGSENDTGNQDQGVVGRPMVHLQQQRMLPGMQQGGSQSQLPPQVQQQLQQVQQGGGGQLPPANQQWAAGGPPMNPQQRPGMVGHMAAQQQPAVSQQQQQMMNQQQSQPGNRALMQVAGIAGGAAGATASGPGGVGGAQQGAPVDAPADAPAGGVPDVGGPETNQAASERSRDSRRLSIQRCIQSLVHACQCRNANCSLPSCQKMKRIVQHTKGCKRKTNGGCPVCKQLIALCCYHAKHCQENKCPVSFCLNIKHKLRQQQLQHRLQQAMRQRKNKTLNRG